MDPYPETKGGLFWLNDDQISLPDFTSLHFATEQCFCLSSGWTVGKRGPYLRARISQNERSDLRGVGERKRL